MLLIRVTSQWLGNQHYWRPEVVGDKKAVLHACSFSGLYQWWVAKLSSLTVERYLLWLCLISRLDTFWSCLKSCMTQRKGWWYLMLGLGCIWDGPFLSSCLLLLLRLSFLFMSRNETVPRTLNRSLYSVLCMLSASCRRLHFPSHSGNVTYGLWIDWTW